MSSLNPVLNSILGPRPAKSASDVQATLRNDVEAALADTDDRIEVLTAEIDDKERARVTLTDHRASLQAWLDNDGTNMISDQRYCEAEPRLIPGPKSSTSTEEQ
jgi:hypothetical protein